MAGPNFFYAGESKPGTAGSPRRAVLEAWIREDIAALLPKVQAVVVSFHGGTEASRAVTESQEKFYRLAVDLGARLVLGHHPHVLQVHERYKDGLIAYSLGNFVFGGNYSKDVYGALLRVDFDAKGGIQDYGFIPLLIKPSVTRYQPRVLTGKAAQPVFDRLGVANPNSIPSP